MSLETSTITPRGVFSWWLCIPSSYNDINCHGHCSLSSLSTRNPLSFEKHEIPTWYLPTVYDIVQKQRPFLVWSERSLHCYGEKHPGQPFDTLTGFNPALRKRNAFEPMQVLCLPSPSLWADMCINLTVSGRCCFLGVFHHRRLLQSFLSPGPDWEKEVDTKSHP